MSFDDEQIFECTITDDEYVLAASLPIMTPATHPYIDEGCDSCEMDASDPHYLLYGSVPQPFLYECCFCHSTQPDHACPAQAPRNSRSLSSPSHLLLLDISNALIQNNYRKWLYTRI